MAEKVETEWLKMLGWLAVIFAVIWALNTIRTILIWVLIWVFGLISSILPIDSAELAQNIKQFNQYVASLIPPVPGWLLMVWVVLVNLGVITVLWLFWQREQAKH